MVEYLVTDVDLASRHIGEWREVRPDGAESGHGQSLPAATPHGIRLERRAAARPALALCRLLARQSKSWVFFRKTPTRIQAMFSATEEADRTIMQGGGSIDD